ncbi:VOC family protein [Microbacterium sp. ET2]|uniref:VOC family protein n=1 Tax=Microbacterium albipurpureum TaxID=3050384 RepID=UPI00259CC798|nr:VOC family protein [Microbacterium sp. ET2 (Ac-2212)]WJL95442.1 VOC family protein [Microbacterium sp. ET2 (Ac-2212)]
MPDSSMAQRVSLITLGVADLERALAFYGALGWTPHAQSIDDVVAFFQLDGFVLALWGRSELAEDSGVVDSGGWGGVTLAHNVSSAAAVDAVLDAAADAGARISRPAGPTPWGGYSGVFVDLDGHPWEVAHNPGWQLDGAGRVSIG